MMINYAFFFRTTNIISYFVNSSTQGSTAQRVRAPTTTTLLTIADIFPGFYHFGYMIFAAQTNTY